MANKINNDLDAAIAYVEDAQTQLAEGNIVVLQDLQQNVAQICEIIASLPVEEGRSYREKMVDLGDKMQALEIDLRAMKIDVERELKSASKNQTAVSAYAKANSSANKKDGE